MSDSEGDWEEEEQLPLPCPCLFCTEECRSGESMVEHCCDTHQIDLVKLRRKLGTHFQILISNYSITNYKLAYIITLTCNSHFLLGLGFYGWVQLINYIRKEVMSV